jgi:hypothetical protein
MPRSPKKLRRDLNETAFDVVRAATGQGERPKRPGEGEPNPEAVKRGRKGGKKGGKARAKRLSAARRSAIGEQAARKRWKGKP